MSDTKSRRGGARPGAGRKPTVKDGQRLDVYLPAAALAEVAAYREHLAVTSDSQALARILAQPRAFEVWRRSRKSTSDG